MFRNVCKFCRSKPGNVVGKFKLTNKRNETVKGHLSNICEELTNCVAPIYAKLAPDSFKNMALFDNETRKSGKAYKLEKIKLVIVAKMFKSLLLAGVWTIL